LAENKFLNPIRDGAVLPVLHLNGYKIANLTVLARIPHDGLAWISPHNALVFTDFQWGTFRTRGFSP
jgi:XFP N-terminal domain